MWWPSGVKVASLTKEAWPRNSFSVLPDLRPWILKRKENFIRGSLTTFKEEEEGDDTEAMRWFALDFRHLMVWSKEALRSWLLSLQKVTHVTPLLWARSNLRRHWPLWIFHTCTHKHTISL